MKETPVGGGGSFLKKKKKKNRERSERLKVLGKGFKGESPFTKGFPPLVCLARALAQRGQAVHSIKVQVPFCLKAVGLLLSDTCPRSALPSLQLPKGETLL